MTKKDKSEGKIIRLQNQEPEELPDFYINQVNMAFSVYDVTFTFGKMAPPGEPPENSEPVVKVRMSPQHAKVFSMLLRKHLKQYEKDIGTINLLPKMIEELGLTGEKEE